MIVCRKCRVQGRVQGVWYRGSTQAQAQTLEVTGYARNLADGSVEVLACGETTQVEALCTWLWQGPRHADVTHVDCEPATVAPPPGFTTA